MRGPFYLQVIDALALLILFAVDPLLFIAIGYYAWKGKPDGFDAKKYAVWAIASAILGTALLVAAKWINADVRTWPYAIQAPCMLIGLLLFGIGCGCACGFVVLLVKRRILQPD